MFESLCSVRIFSFWKKKKNIIFFNFATIVVFEIFLQIMGEHCLIFYTQNYINILSLRCKFSFKLKFVFIILVFSEDTVIYFRVICVSYTHKTHNFFANYQYICFSCYDSA